MKTAETDELDSAPLEQDETAVDWERIKEALLRLRVDWEDQSLPRRLRFRRNSQRPERHSSMLDRNILRQRVCALNADWREQAQARTPSNLGRGDLFRVGRLFQNLFFH